MNIPNSTTEYIIGRFGIALAKIKKNKKVQVVFRQTHHTFQPLLYQVATGLEAGSIAYPIRKVIQEYDEFYFRLTNVQEIDTKTKNNRRDWRIVTITSLLLPVLKLIIGNKEIERNSMAMKTIPQSLNIRV
jgi:NADH dehydrogenase